VYAGSLSPEADEKGKIGTEATRHGLRAQLRPTTPT